MTTTPKVLHIYRFLGHEMSCLTMTENPPSPSTDSKMFYLGTITLDTPARRSAESNSELSKLREIADLAQKVRAAQKKYFNTRWRDDLIASKTAEHALDAALTSWDLMNAAQATEKKE